MNFNNCIRCTYYDSDMVKHHKKCTNHPTYQHNLKENINEINKCCQCKWDNIGHILTHDFSKNTCEYNKLFSEFVI